MLVIFIAGVCIGFGLPKPIRIFYLCNSQKKGNYVTCN